MTKYEKGTDLSSEANCFKVEIASGGEGARDDEVDTKFRRGGHGMPCPYCLKPPLLGNSKPGAGEGSVARRERHTVPYNKEATISH